MGNRGLLTGMLSVLFSRSLLLSAPQACGVCYSDHYAVIGAFGATYPTSPGHEVVGKVHGTCHSHRRWC